MVLEFPCAPGGPEKLVETHIHWTSGQSQTVGLWMGPGHLQSNQGPAVNQIQED